MKEESTRSIPRPALSPVAIRKRPQHAKPTSMWVATQDLPRSAAHPHLGTSTHTRVDAPAGLSASHPPALQRVTDRHPLKREVISLSSRLTHLRSCLPVNLSTAGIRDAGKRASPQLRSVSSHPQLAPCLEVSRATRGAANPELIEERPVVT